MWKDAIDVSDGMLASSRVKRQADTAVLADDFSSVIETNLFAPFYLSRALVRHWLKLPTALSASASSSNTSETHRDQKIDLNKKILFISSISGIVAMNPQPQAAYNSSKAGLTMLAKVCFL